MNEPETIMLSKVSQSQNTRSLEQSNSETESRRGSGQGGDGRTGELVLNVERASHSQDEKVLEVDVVRDA